MIRANIVVEGDLWATGYRVYVVRIAHKLGVVGYVESMPDGTVSVVCEGEKENIEKFINSIRVKTETISVENVKVTYEEDTGEFVNKGFLSGGSDPIMETFEGYATATNYTAHMMNKLRDSTYELRKYQNKVEEVREIVEKETKKITDAVESIHEKFKDVIIGGGSRYDVFKDRINILTVICIAILFALIGLLIK